MANSTDKWAKGNNAAYFNQAVKSTKAQIQSDEKGRTDNAQSAGKQGGPSIARGDGFSANASNGAQAQGAEKRGQAIHRKATRGPENQR